MPGVRVGMVERERGEGGAEVIFEKKKRFWFQICRKKYSGSCFIKTNLVTDMRKSDY